MNIGEFVILAGLVLCFAGIEVIHVSLYKIFKKMRLPGYYGLIPFWNGFVLFRELWWGRLFFLIFIPIAGLFAAEIISSKLAYGFGKGDGFTAGLFLFPILFLPVLAFGDSCYQYDE